MSKLTERATRRKVNKVIDKILKCEQKDFQKLVSKHHELLKGNPLEYFHLLYQYSFVCNLEMSGIVRPDPPSEDQLSLKNCSYGDFVKTSDYFFELSVIHLNLAASNNNIAYICRELAWMRENHPEVFGQ
jgi:hypothetical protein